MIAKLDDQLARARAQLLPMCCLNFATALQLRRKAQDGGDRITGNPVVEEECPLPGSVSQKQNEDGEGSGFAVAGACETSGTCVAAAKVQCLSDFREYVKPFSRSFELADIAFYLTGFEEADREQAEATFRENVEKKIEKIDKRLEFLGGKLEEKRKMAQEGQPSAGGRFSEFVELMEEFITLNKLHCIDYAHFIR